LEEGRGQMMRAVDVRVHRRDAIGATFGDERLRREMVALIELVAADDVEDRSVGFEARGMERDVLQQMSDAREAALRVFQGDAAHETMHLVACGEQQLGQVAAVLPGDAGDEGLLLSQTINSALVLFKI